MEDTFTVGLVQHACQADTASNIATAIAGIRKARELGAELVCLQELFNNPYFCTVQTQDRFALAETIPGPTISQFQIVAAELSTVVVVPIFERRAPGVYHNSAAVIDADGRLLGVYRKMHIPDDPLYFEKYYFTPGDVSKENTGFRIFQTKYAKIGVLICWDQWYPEAARITALLGAEVLFYPTAIGWHPAEKAEMGNSQLNAWQCIQKAHSIANGIYVCAVNRVGHEATPGTGGIEFFGHSFVSDPFGNVLAEASESNPDVLVATCSRKRIESTRRNWPFLRDRRVDAYQPICCRYLD